MDLVLEGKAVMRGRIVEAMVAVENGRIARVAKTLPSSMTARARHVAVRGVILPGAVDAHVHFREPGLEHKERVASGTLAALHGGVTTALDMPNTQPAVQTRAALEDKQARFEASARVDWGLYAMVDPDLRVFELGSDPIGYKLYLGGSTNAPGVAPGSVGAAARRACQTGRPLVVHAEHPDHLEPTLDDARAHGAARPPVAEWDAIVALANHVPDGARVSVAHVTTAKGLAAAKRAGLWAEASPHHLLLDERALERLGPAAKVNPPLRGPKDRAALWKAFVAGKVDTLGSDHAPHTREEKALGFAKAPSGMPGVETMLPLMLAKVKAGALGLPTLVRAACAQPARLFGLPKGRIEEGLDADLVVVDLKRVEPIVAARLHSACGWSCFEGEKAVFPRDVWLRGEEALRDGEALPTRGQQVRPTASTVATRRP
jgi:dihydroorotase